MAFGDIKGTKTGTLTSITASFPCSTGTSFAVVVGDLIVAACAEQTAMTVTACADNLGNTYAAIGAGADAGTVTGRAFYSRITNAGTISSVTFTATASNNNCVGLAVGFEGPFAVSPLDKAPTAIINDNTTPYTCPATGALAQADEKIVNLIVHNGAPTFTATAPNLKAVELATATVLKAALGHQTVTSTASVTPAWTSSATPTVSGYGTASFKRAPPVSIADAWDAANKNANISLTNNDKTATSTGTGTVRTTQAWPNETAGKRYAEFKIEVRTSTSDVGLQPLSSAVGSSANSIEVLLSSALIKINGTPTGLTIGASVNAGDVVCMAWDAAAERIWFRLNNGLWNNNAAADPATGANGLDISAALGVENCALWARSQASGKSFSVRTETADLTLQGPAGFTSWMGEAIPQADAWSASDKTNITLTNSDKTATVSATTCGVHSTQTRTVNVAGKYYAEFKTEAIGGTNAILGLHLVTGNKTDGGFSGGIYLRTDNGGLWDTVTKRGDLVTSFANGDIACLAWDAVAKTFWFRKNGGLWNNSGTADPATGTGGLANAYTNGSNLCLWFGSGAVGNSITIRTELADLTLQGPAGYTTWMGEAIPLPSTADAWNVNDKLTVTLSNNDKTATTTSSDAGVRSTQAQTSGTAGKYYAEFLIVGSNAGTYGYGIAPTSGALNSPIARFHVQASTGNIRINNTAVGPSLGAIAVDDVISVAWDAGASLVWFRKNAGNWNNTAGNNPATNVGGLDTSFAASTPHALWVGSTVNGAGITLRTETAEFTQATPTGFLSWMGEALTVLPVEGTGTLAAQAATMVAPGVASSVGTGALVAVDSTGQRGSGAAIWNASGALVADVADLDAVGDVTWQPRTGTGALIAVNTTGQRGAGVSQSVNTAQSLVAINSTGQRGAGVSGSINTLTALTAGVADLDAVGQVTSAPAIGTGALVSATAVLAGVGVMTNYTWTRPGSDVAADGWTDQAGGVSNIYTTLDEPYAANDSDYVKSPTGAGDLVVRLFEGSTQIATWSHVNPPDTFTTAEQTLTTPQYAAISDFSNLFVEFDDSQSNVYRFKLGATTFADPPVTLRYRYKKTA